MNPVSPSLVFAGRKDVGRILEKLADQKKGAETPTMEDSGGGYNGYSLGRGDYDRFNNRAGLGTSAGKRNYGGDRSRSQGGGYNPLGRTEREPDPPHIELFQELTKGDSRVANFATMDSFKENDVDRQGGYFKYTRRLAGDYRDKVADLQAIAEFARGGLHDRLGRYVWSADARNLRREYTPYRFKYEAGPGGRGIWTAKWDPGKSHDLTRVFQGATAAEVIRKITERYPNIEERFPRDEHGGRDRRPRHSRVDREFRGADRMVREDNDFGQRFRSLWSSDDDLTDW